MEQDPNEVIERQYAPCNGKDIRSCKRIDVDFNTYRTSQDLKFFCTNVRQKDFLLEDDDTKFYEVSD